jgi:hypothetical protein
VKNKSCLMYTRETERGYPYLGLISALHLVSKIFHKRSEGNWASTLFGLVLFWVFVILRGSLVNLNIFWVILGHQVIFKGVIVIDELGPRH